VTTGPTTSTERKPNHAQISKTKISSEEASVAYKRSNATGKTPPSEYVKTLTGKKDTKEIQNWTKEKINISKTKNERSKRTGGEQKTRVPLKRRNKKTTKTERPRKSAAGIRPLFTYHSSAEKNREKRRKSTEKKKKQVQCHLRNGETVFKKESRVATEKDQESPPPANQSRQGPRSDKGEGR